MARIYLLHWLTLRLWRFCNQPTDQSPKCWLVTSNNNNTTSEARRGMCFPWVDGAPRHHKNKTFRACEHFCHTVNAGKGEAAPRGLAPHAWSCCALPYQSRLDALSRHGLRQWVSEPIIYYSRHDVRVDHVPGDKCPSFILTNQWRTSFRLMTCSTPLLRCCCPDAATVTVAAAATGIAAASRGHWLYGSHD